MSEMVERVARAMRERYAKHNGDKGLVPFEAAGSREAWMECARAAIEAMREPTEAMVVAMDEHAGTIAPQYAYEAAIDAALTTS